jgi:hypothetical protein
MTLTKATIEILHRPDERFDVQFNPNTLSLKKDVVVSEIGIPGLNSPLLQFVRGEAEVLDLELFCDTTREGLDEGARDVREFTAPIRQLAEVDPDIQSIPVIRFSWGKGLSFTAVLVAVEQSFTLFNPDGVPLRAHLRVRLKEFRTHKEQLRDVQTDGRGGRPAVGEKPVSAERGPDVPRIQPTVSRISVNLSGKPVGEEVARDLLQLVFSDSLDANGRFELTLNDQDEGGTPFKYADELPFRPGTVIGISLLEGAETPAPPVLEGVIESARHTSHDGHPVLVVAGFSEGAKKVRSDRRKPLRLAYGRSLIEFEPSLALAGTVDPPGRERGRRRESVRVTATGVTVGLPDLRPGDPVIITGVGRRFSGEYYVQGTTHTVGDRGYTTRFECFRRDMD